MFHCSNKTDLIYPVAEHVNKLEQSWAETLKTSTTHNNLWLHCLGSLYFVFLSLLQKALISQKLKNTSYSYPTQKPWRQQRKAGYLQHHTKYFQWKYCETKTEVSIGVQGNIPLCFQTLLSLLAHRPLTWSIGPSYISYVQLVTSLLQQSVPLWAPEEITALDCA